MRRPKVVLIVTLTSLQPRTGAALAIPVDYDNAEFRIEAKVAVV